MKAKGLIERIRYWIIEKLGGYTRQQVFISTSITRTITCKPIRFRADVCIPYEGVLNLQTPERVRQVKAMLTWKIAERLAEEDAILLISREVPEEDAWIIEARLEVIPARTVAETGGDVPW